MKLSDEFRARLAVEKIARSIQRLRDRPTDVMSVCGTHTMSIARFGLKALLPPDLRMIAGPGCPVCVTAQSDIDKFLALGKQPDVILTSFGDMVRVPGSAGSLERLRAAGADVRVVYSPLDALSIAERERDRQVVFFGVGFETTMPATALAIRSAAEARLPNFSVYCVHKTMPNALGALLSTVERGGLGLLLPGHVATIAGADAFSFIPEQFGIPCAVTGFEPVDIMLGVEAIVRQLRDGVARIDNTYRRAVQSEPNPQATSLLDNVFAVCDSEWRGLGVIANGGCAISARYAECDAGARFADVLASVPAPEPSACRCGDVLCARLEPRECPLFGTNCTPTEPVGPCMVSSEGACAAEFRYGGE